MTASIYGWVTIPNQIILEQRRRDREQDTTRNPQELVLPSWSRLGSLLEHRKEFLERVQICVPDEVLDPHAFDIDFNFILDGETDEHGRINPSGAPVTQMSISQLSREIRRTGTAPASRNQTRQPPQEPTKKKKSTKTKQKKRGSSSPQIQDTEIPISEDSTSTSSGSESHGSEETEVSGLESDDEDFVSNTTTSQKQSGQMSRKTKSVNNDVLPHLLVDDE